MKHNTRTLALWLISSFSLPHGVTLAQSSFVAALSPPSNVAAQTAQPNTTTQLTIPAGTHVLMKLTRPLHTTSATPGAGVYLEISAPVIADDRIAIPEKTRVFGFIEKSRRPGRTHGRARLRMRFTQFILPDDRVLTISGNLQSLPGSAEHRTTDEQGTLEPVDQIDGEVYTVAVTTGLGVLAGSISHMGIGVGPGAAIGLGLGLAKALFTRGDEIFLPIGTEIEMVLQHPLTIDTHPMEAHHDSANHGSIDHDPAENDSTIEDSAPRHFALETAALDNAGGVARNRTINRCEICE